MRRKFSFDIPKLVCGLQALRTWGHPFPYPTSMLTF